MLRQSLLASARMAARSAPSKVVGRRSASTTEKIKEAAAAVAPGHHKPSSDVPWLIGSLLVFAPTLFYMTAPKSAEHHHTPPAKEKFKPKLRMPDPGAEHYKIPEEVGDKAGEGRPHGDGDHGLRALQDEHEHMIEHQKSPPPAESASNHDHSSGLKGDSEKFNAAARGAQQLNQQGGGEAARNTKVAVAAARAAAEDKRKPAGYKSGDTPEDTGDQIGKKLTAHREETASEEKDEKDSGEDKAERT